MKFVCCAALLLVQATCGLSASSVLSKSSGRAVVRKAAAAVAERQPMPRNARVAVLLRGEAFRLLPKWKQGSIIRQGKVCADELRQAQLEATQSLMENVVKPLEANGNSVDLYVIVHEENCTHTQSLLDKLGRRTRATKICNSDSQYKNMRTALDFFKEQVREQFHVSNIMERYSLIMIARHDLVWEMPISELPEVNYGNFNFFSMCEKRPFTTFARMKNDSTPVFPKDPGCVNDIFHMMHASQFAAFDSAVGKETCFDQKDYNAPFGGHGCYDSVASSIGEEQISFLSDWRPAVRVRDHNPIVNLLIEECEECQES
jgi:hypothetical protein